MKRFSEQLKKKSDTIRLRASEKAELQSRIVAFMEYHPLPASVKSTPVPKSTVVFENYRSIFIPRAYVRNFIGVSLVLFLIVIPTFAENSIPGDILYPVKVNFTEEIRSTLNTKSYEKVVWETTRLERRVAEARQLAEAGKLTPEIEAQVMAAVKLHSTEAKRQIETLRSTDADGASLAQMTFATALDVQSSVLKANDSASTTAGRSTVALASILNDSFNEVSINSSIDNVSVVRLVAQLEIETTRSYELLESLKKTATPQEQTDVRRRLSDLESKIKASTSEAGESNDKVKAELRRAWTDVQKLISFMSDIDVRHALTVENLVPVVMSDSEKLAYTVQKYEQVNSDLQRIKFGLPLITETAISEKITLSIPKIINLLKTSSSSLQLDINTAKVAVEEAQALTDSILNLYRFPALTEIPKDEASTSTATSTNDVSNEVIGTVGSTTTTVTSSSSTASERSGA